MASVDCEVFSMSSLRKFLREFEILPDTHRVTVWKTILELPCNKDEYILLRDRGKKNIPKGSFNLKQTHEVKTVLNVLHSLLIHSPSLKHLDDFVTSFTQPFAVMLGNNELVFFEIVLSILINYCQHWFDHIPQAPYTFLSMLDIVMLKQAPELYRHLATRGIRCINYMWNWMCSAFTCIVDSAEWPILWDHIICNEPSFIGFIPLAACTLSSHHLLALQNHEDIMGVLRDFTPRDSYSLLQEAYRLYENTPSNIHPSLMTNQFCPIPKEKYPTLNCSDLISFGSLSDSSTKVENLLDAVRKNGVAIDDIITEGFSLRFSRIKD